MIQDLIRRLFGRPTNKAMTPEQRTTHKENNKMTTYTIFGGTGSMGTAIAGVLDKGGATTVAVSSTEAPTATIEGDVVILAVPYPAVDEIISTHRDALEQFEVSDPRTVEEVAAALRRMGMEPVWKDWDSSFDRVRCR